MSGGTNIYPNPFTLNTGTVYQNFVVAVPQGANGISLGSVIDLDASSQNLLSDYRQNISTISVTDRTGNNAQNYTVFRMTQASPYSPSHAHVVTTTGVFP